MFGKRFYRMIEEEQKYIFPSGCTVYFINRFNVYKQTLSDEPLLLQQGTANGTEYQGCDGNYYVLVDCGGDTYRVPLQNCFRYSFLNTAIENILRALLQETGKRYSLINNEFVQEK